MTQQIINIGSAPNDGTGDPARNSFDKCNQNFTELYQVSRLTGTPQGRLTLQTATPVMTTTQSAKTTIYYTPYCGNLLPIYNGTTMTMTTFAELSVATSDTTKSPAAIGASKVNDWFVWSDASTIRIGHGPDWTSDTVRSAGTALVMVAGVLLNNASITNGPAAQRGTYVGTTRSNASSQLDWIYPTAGAPPTAGAFNVWNTYNRETVAGTVQDTTANWTYASTTARQARGDTTFLIAFVFGLTEDAVLAILAARTSGSSSANSAYMGFGIDSTITTTGLVTSGVNGVAQVGSSATHHSTLLFGYHYIALLEYMNGATSGSFFGEGCGLTLQLRM